MDRHVYVPMICAGIAGTLGGSLLTWVLVVLDLMP